MGLTNFFTKIKLNNQYRKALKKYNKGNFDEALVLFESLLQRAPEYGEASIVRALIYANSKNEVDKALTILEKIPHTSETYPRSIEARIIILNKANKKEEAIELYNLLPRTSKNYCYYVFQKYRILDELKRYKEALTYMHNALDESHNEDYLEGLRIIGGLYFRLKDSEKGKEYITKANDLSAQWFAERRIYSMITASMPEEGNLTDANTAFNEKKYKDAIMYFEKYAENEKPNASTLNTWALALLRYGWNLDSEHKSRYLQQAIELGNRAIELNSKNEVYHGNLGLYMLQLALLDNNLSEKKDEIVAAFMRGEELQQGTSAYNMACLYAIMNEIEDAFKWFEVMLKHEPVSRSSIESDDDFEALKKDSRFNELLDIYL